MEFSPAGAGWVHDVNIIVYRVVCLLLCLVRVNVSGDNVRSRCCIASSLLVRTQVFRCVVETCVAHAMAELSNLPTKRWGRSLQSVGITMVLLSATLRKVSHIIQERFHEPSKLS
jgi:hypothetical protein